MKHQKDFPLFPLISRLQLDLIPNAIGKKSFIANDVERDIRVTANEDVLAFLVKQLISHVVNNTENGYISIKTVCSARGECRICIQKYDMVSIRIAALDVEQLRESIELLGGFISVTDQKPGEVGIVFPMVAQNKA